MHGDRCFGILRAVSVSLVTITPHSIIDCMACGGTFMRQTINLITYADDFLAFVGGTKKQWDYYQVDKGVGRRGSEGSSSQPSWRGLSLYLPKVKIANKL